MTAVGVAGRVGVVLEQVDLAADAFFTQPLLGAADETFEVALPRLVVDDEIGDRVALGRGVLGVAAHVEVEAGAVLEEDVARPAPRHDPAEQVPGDLVGAQAALAAQRARDPVLVLEPEDPAFHTPTLQRRGRVAVTVHVPTHDPLTNEQVGSASNALLSSPPSPSASMPSMSCPAVA